MKRILRLTGLIAGATLAVLFLAFAVLIHPNDARVDFPDDLVKGPIKDFFTRRASLLVNKLPHAVDLDRAAFEAKRKGLLAALPDYALPASARFVSPYQIYVPVGSYPLRLDAQDGLFVPSGATLTVAPALSGTFEVRLAAFSPRGAATLTLAAGGKAPLATLELPAAPDPDFDANKSSYKNFGRFFSVDPMERLETWHETRQPVTLAAGDKLTFRCDGGAFGCIVGDVGIYARAAEPPQNVVVILVDTLRGDAVRAGNAPRLQALADQGVDFTHALAAGNMTSPSTNAFLSCRRPSQLGNLAFAYTVSNEYREDYYQTRHASFPARFLKGGYDTAMIGNVSVISEIYGVGVNHGFARQVSLETDGYDTPHIAREAVRWLAANGDHRFLLYLHFNGPHAPYRAPLKDIVSTYPGLDGFASYSKALLWLYQSEVAYTDRYVGKVLDALKALGLDERTTIVLTADHGDQQRTHAFTGNTVAPDFTGAYFDHGATLLNDEINVPLVIRKPGLAPRRVDDYVSTLDVGPTLLDMTGAADAKGCAGLSLTPYLAGSDATALRQRPLASEGFRGRTVLLDNRWKYIRTYEPTDKRVYGASGWSGEKRLYMVPEQLFDLARDPGEEHDLAAAKPAVLERARKVYRDIYDVKDAYELVVETPNGSPFVATLPPGATPRFEEGDGQIAATPADVRVSGKGHKRYLVELKGDPKQLLTVSIGGKPLRLAMTSIRLPLDVAPAALPAEIGGRYTLLDAGKTPVAYLRKVEDDGQKNRRIMTGNPAFEKVLREWGYLNDK